MKSKVLNFLFTTCLFVLSLSSCSTPPTLNTRSFPTPSNTPSPASHYTPTFAPSTPTLAPETAFIKGVTLNNFGPRLDSQYTQDVIQNYIIPAGINYVALNPTCMTNHEDDVVINCNYENRPGLVPTLSDQELINAIDYLHSAGLRVILKPHSEIIVDLLKTSPESHDRGNGWDEAEWTLWFDNYIDFITHYAEIAEDNNVDLFVIGNEQEDTTHREEDWRRVIAAVRGVYHGPITYAANAWQFEASHIKFWDALDHIGTNAYNYFFVPFHGSTAEEMEQAWQPYIRQLEEMSIEYNKQVLFTEFGARSQEGYNTGSVQEWSAAPYDGQEQADHYTAFFEAIEGRTWIKGVILWDVYTSPLQGGQNDISYTFIGKPAENVLRKFFGGQPIIPTETPNFIEKPNETMIVYDEHLMTGWRPWYAPEDKTAPDFKSLNGYESSYSIRVAYSEYIGLFLTHDSPPLDLEKYKWLEFYVMVGNNQPKHLLAVFENWTTGINIGSKMVLVNDPRYIEGGQYQPGTWQRVRIPLIDLGLTDQASTGFNILGCAWPCDFDYNTDDVYIDDIKLIAGE